MIFSFKQLVNKEVALEEGSKSKFTRWVKNNFKY